MSPAPADAGVKPKRLFVIGGVIGSVLLAHRASPVHTLIGVGVGLGLYSLAEKVLERPPR